MLHRYQFCVSSNPPDACTQKPAAFLIVTSREAVWLFPECKLHGDLRSLDSCARPVTIQPGVFRMPCSALGDDDTQNEAFSAMVKNLVWLARCGGESSVCPHVVHKIDLPVSVLELGC